MYDIELAVDVDGKMRSCTKKNYIIALADTVKADSCFGESGSDICITVKTFNTTPIHYMFIPIEYPGDVSLTLDSLNTNGCRTDYFEVCELTQFDPFNKRFVVHIRTDDIGVNPPLPSGEGDVVNVYMSISGSATDGQSATIHFDGYDTHTPAIYSDYLNYSLESVSSAVIVGCCQGIRGNIDGDENDTIDIADLVYFVEYQFGDGPAPVCFDGADLDASEELDIADIVYFVDYAFNGGPAPLGCM